MASPAETTQGGTRPSDIDFVVEATTTRNEKLKAQISDRNARKAKQRATTQFMCEGHNVLSATVSRVKVSDK